MKSITPNIALNNCKEALEFYKEVFGGEVRNVQTGKASAMFAGHEDKIIHSELHINPNCVLYLNDIMDDRTPGGSISLIPEMDSEEEINRAYEALKKDGKTVFELQKTFWGALHAVVIDKFGISWSLNYSASRG